MKSLLNSRYVINGVQKELTPAQLLGDDTVPEGEIVDETLDPDPGVTDFHSSLVDSYAEAIEAAVRRFPRPFAADFTKFRIAGALIDALWKKGSYRIGDLSIKLDWKGTGDKEVCSPATFYTSVESAADYIDGLGLSVAGYSLSRADSESFSAEAVLAGHDGEEDVFVEQPYRSENPVMEQERISGRMSDDTSDWLVYIPFDSADFNLGGSMLAQATGKAGGVSPNLGDADYFLDCWEVVRELVEDGIVKSAVSVGDGGLLVALRKMAAGNVGAEVDLSDMAKALGEPKIVRLLFAEVPGVVIEISDQDFDYLDAELLLQDVAYYPLGHPDPALKTIRARAVAKSGIQVILDSLIQNQGAEGED